MLASPSQFDPVTPQDVFWFRSGKSIVLWQHSSRLLPLLSSLLFPFSLLGHRVRPSSPSSIDFDLLVFLSLINCDSREPDCSLSLVISLNMFVQQKLRKKTSLLNENACTSEVL